MPKLFYTDDSCSAASFIAAFTANVRIDTDQVEFDDQHSIKRLSKTDKADFHAINPKKNVPTLVLDDGTVLNENLAVLQYIADLVSEHIVHVMFE